MKLIKGLEEAKTFLFDIRKYGIDNIPNKTLNLILESNEKIFGKKLTPLQTVEIILDEVKIDGDKALKKYTSLIEGFKLEQIKVSEQDISDAYNKIPLKLIEALKTASQRVSDFHSKTIQKSWMDNKKGWGQIIQPMNIIGTYAPGGTATYPSTVIMTVVPAKIAGVEKVILCTPTKNNLPPDPSILVAADISGVDEIFQIGGAQAIAAMAYGTKTIPAVDMICGPGNIFVTIAKKLLFGQVGIDGLFGPTEAMLIADESSDPDYCCADLLAQAEHDILAKPILITTSQKNANQVKNKINYMLPKMKRSKTAKLSIETQGAIILLNELDDAFDLANIFSPEHLSLMVENPLNHLDKIKNAGAIFIGEYSHEVLGDYIAGPSHVMPTGGSAKFNSGLGVHTFLKYSPVLSLPNSLALELGKTASTIAEAEGLYGHYDALKIREKKSSVE